MSESRVHKSLLNAKVNLVFYFLSLFFAFFSRKIFLDNLGAEFIGLTGTLGNILGYLNLAEMGIGAAIGFTLFKPIQSGNREEMTEILSLYGYLYKKIGTFIFIAACAVSLSFPFVFKNSELSFGIIYFAYFSFVTSTLMGYWLNYREILLNSDQKHYVVAIYFQSAGIVKTIVQLLLAYYWGNLYAWVAIEFIFGVLGCIVLNWKINKVYPWLQTDTSRGKQLLKKYPNILKSTRQVFIHQMKDFMLGKTDEILIFAFVSLKMVAYYGNYTIIITKAGFFFSAIINSFGAGVGNLVAEGNHARMLKVFWELMAIRHFIAAFLVFCVYFLIEPFITLWLGQEYIIDHTILVFMLIYLYIGNTREVVDMFNSAFGHYADVWSAWAELAINLFVTIVFGLKYGIIGILLGKIVSTFFIIVLWKPYYLFSQGFNLPIAVYWKGTIRYVAIFAVIFLFGKMLIYRLPLDPYAGFTEWITYSAIVVLSFVIAEVSMLYAFTPGTRTLLKRIKLPFKLKNNL